MGNLENWTNGKFGQLKQWKIWKTEPMGNLENWTNGKFGKLNQWEIWKTETMENFENWTNLHLPLCTFNCRKVLRHEHPRINVLSIVTSSYFNVETEPRMKSCGDRETEPLENFHLRNGISTSAIMKKTKKWPPFYKYIYIYMHHTEKCQIADQSLGVWLSEYQWKWNFGVSS